MFFNFKRVLTSTLLVSLSALVYGHTLPFDYLDSITEKHYTSTLLRGNDVEKSDYTGTGIGTANASSTTVGYIITGDSVNCAADAVDLLLSGYTGGSIQWQMRYSGSWINLTHTTPQISQYAYANCEFRAIVSQGTTTDTTAVHSVQINLHPNITWPQIGPLCENSNPVTINTTPVGGTFTSVGMTGNMFDPSLVGASSHHAIYYTYTDSNGCTSSDSTVVQILANSDAGTIASDSSVCYGDFVDLDVTGYNGTVIWQRKIVGGSWVTFDSNTDSTSSAIFNSTEFRTIVSNQSCPSDTSAPFQVTMDSLFVTIDPVATLCENGGPVTLTGSPVGGSFSGPGVSGNSFDPQTTGAGNFLVVYQYTSPTSGCTAEDSTVITVDSSAIGGTFVNSNVSICSEDSVYLQLIGYNSNILYWESSIDQGNTWNTIIIQRYILTQY